MTTKRSQANNKVILELFPAITYSDAEAIKVALTAHHWRTLPPSIAVWLVAIAYIRHTYTDYDRLRDEGYDKDSALYFIRADINEILTSWRSTRFLEDEYIQSNED